MKRFNRTAKRLVGASLLATLATSSCGGARPAADARPSVSPNLPASTRSLPSLEVLATVAVGSQPTAITVDPTTHTAYVSNAGSDTVSVIDGGSRSVVATIAVGSRPGSTAVDFLTHTVYVANRDSDTISVLDGRTNHLLADVPTGALPGGPSGVGGLVADPVARALYVPNQGSRSEMLKTGSQTGTISVFDLPTLRVNRTHALGSSASSYTREVRGLAFDSQARAVYIVTNRAGAPVLAAVTGRTYESASASILYDEPGAVAVDSATHRVYVSAPTQDRVAVLDGTTPQTLAEDNFQRPTFIDVGRRPMGLAIDPVSQLVYVANSAGDSVSVIDENTNKTMAVAASPGRPWALAVDPTTHLVFVSNQDAGTVSILQGLPPAVITPHDQRYFSQTGFRVDNDTVWDYFLHRGGITTFGYPISRTFRFQAFTVQFFQRRIVEVGNDGRARLLNLLDAGLLPYTSFSFSVFPGADQGLKSQMPDPTDAVRSLAFVKSNAPDVVNGTKVDFYTTFKNSVSAADAFPDGRGNAGLLDGFALEMWGLPTSRPTPDPNNPGFIYLRWQRGIMMYDASCGCTQGILLADYLKSVITGQDLPQDLEKEAVASPFFRQYNSSRPGWLRKPQLLPETDLTNAFTPQ